MPTSDPVDPATAEISARLDELWPTWKACLLDPPKCDIESLIAEYATPESPAADLFRSIHSDLIANDYHGEHLERLRPFVASIDISGDNPVSHVCELDGAAVVSSDGQVVNDEVGYFRFNWVWSQVDDRWIVVAGENKQLNQTGSSDCDVYFR